MKVTEIIRKVLDVIDQAEEQEQVVVQQEPEPISAEVEIQINDPFSDEVRRFQQIAGLTPDCAKPLIANAPDEKYANVDAVTTLAGGGVNAPKHPADIKSATMPMYPGKVYGSQ